MMHRVHVLFTLAAVSLSAQTPSADSAPADPPVTFRSDVSLVRVDARVVDRQNQPITGLRMEDFVLREDGKPVEIRNFLSESLPVDVILLLDVSRSMEPHVQRIAAAADRALRVLGDRDRIAIMVFDRSTRLRLPFRGNRQDAERELNRVLNEETFTGGTDITRGLLDASRYMTGNARSDARRAIVVLTDDQTERDRDEARVLRALSRADSVLSALIAPDALHTGSARRVPLPPGMGSLPRSGLLGELLNGWTLPGGPGPVILGPRTQAAGTAEIARQSGGESTAVENTSAFEDTLARIRERYALYFYLPEGVKPGEERAIQVELSDAARRRYPGAEVRYRRSYMAPNGASDPEGIGKVWVSLPRMDAIKACS
jgi:VWFA-related protein